MTRRNLCGCCTGGCESLPSSSFSVPAVLLYSIFRPFVFPKTAICVFRVIGIGSLACFSLSCGFNQRCIPEPWTDKHTLTDTHTHLHALQRQQVVLAVCWDTWRKRSIRKKDATHCLPPRCATLQQRLITVPSAQLSWGFPKYIFQLKLTQAERGKLSSTQFRHRFFSLFDQKPQPNSLIFQVLRGV